MLVLASRVQRCVLVPSVQLLLGLVLQAVPAAVPESEGDESEEDESEILEESPCGRWLKRREEVSSSYGD